MSKYLVIVESPAKSKTIESYLGTDYDVKSSLGHIRDLPSKGTLGSGMGVDPEDGWKAEYALSDRHKKTIAELKRSAKKAEEIFLATDPDREGEAIAWHLAEVLGNSGKKSLPKVFRRVVFNEITRKAIQASFASPKELDLNLVEAQRSRRFLDRVVGYKISPLLWKRNLRGASAGRVQSVALRLLVERERAIRAFVPEEYWLVDALMEVAGQEILFSLVRMDGKAFKSHGKEETEKHLQQLRELLEVAVISARDDRPLSPRPGAPFITSSLQRTASSQMSYGIKRTMQLAQKLYEAGLITYMRTDSTHISEEALDTVRGMIPDRFPSKGQDSYLPSEARVYSSRAGAQESHEAIRPTDPARAADQLSKDIDPAAKRLYDIIYRRFVASQMSNSRLLRTKLKIQVQGADHEYELDVQGRVTLFDGFLRVWREGLQEDVALPEIPIGTEVRLKKLISTQKFTSPPRRYTESALVRELEKRGIGRPSTYADIVSTLQKRGYTRLENKHFIVERLGEVVCLKLEGSFPELMNYDFTAGMEQSLDRVAAGELSWHKLLDEFYAGFRERLQQANDAETGMAPMLGVDTDVKCPECGRNMALRLSSGGLFLGCTGYQKAQSKSKPVETCTKTLNLHPVQYSAPDGAKGIEAMQLPRNCEKCGEPALVTQVDESRQLWICGRSPLCDWTDIEQGNFANMGVIPKPNTAIHISNLSCDKHPEDYFILRSGRNGLFLAGSGFPKRREARSIKVSELALVNADDLDGEHQYLFTAPLQDSQGRATEIAFSKKTGQHYVRTAGVKRNEGQWTAYFEEGNASWKGVESKPSAASKKAAGAKKSAAGTKKAATGAKKSAAGAKKKSASVAKKKTDLSA
ncbi:MAG: type I DNA topoisomerase [Gammaproteobacteria bacterium]